MTQSETGSRPTHVAKVGGSLLSLPDLPDRLEKTLSPCSDQRTLLVVGGGPSVDILRQRFQSGTLANDAAHWAAIARMSETAAGLARTMPGVPLLKSFAACRRLPSGLAILDPQLELRADAGRTLPVGWDVTSDSIAAWCAMRLCASRLSLLKSVGKGDPIDVGDAIRDGWLDGHFPSLWDAWIAHRCRVEWINLRHHPPTAAPLVRRRTAML